MKVEAEVEVNIVVKEKLKLLQVILRETRGILVLTVFLVIPQERERETAGMYINNVGYIYHYCKY